MLKHTTKLFHFTNLLQLPDVLRCGITEGEVPTGPRPPSERPSAANLTTDSQPFNQMIWVKSTPTKLMVRLTVELPKDELTTFQQIVNEYRVPSEWLKIIAPGLCSEGWYFAFGGVKPEQIIRVSRLTKTGYKSMDEEELATLVSDIEAEKAEKWEEYRQRTGINNGARAFRLKPGFRESWLMELPDWLTAELRKGHAVGYLSKL